MIEINARRCNHCGSVLETDDTLVCGPCVEESMAPWVPAEKVAAKSSAAALACGACQGCGCRMDGKPTDCDCPCHGGDE